MTSVFATNRAPCSQASGVENLRVEIVLRPSDIEHEWRQFEEHAIGTAFQSYAWLDAWCSLDEAVSRERPVIVVGRDPDGAIGFIWPMAITTWNGLPILTWLAQGQNWYNGGLWRDDVVKRFGRDDITVVLAGLGELFPELDAVHLLAQPLELRDQINPFVRLPHTMSPGQTYSFACGPGSRVEHRLAGPRPHFSKKMRRLDKVGAVSFSALSQSHDRSAAMQQFLGWKAARLATLGLSNGFADEATRAFHCELAARAGSTSALRVDALRVGDESVALALSLRFQGRAYYLNNAYADDPWLLQNSPGLLVSESLVAQAVADQMTVFDYGPGESAEKASWNALPSDLFETFLSLSATGWVATAGRRLRSNLVRHVKSTPELAMLTRYVMRGLRRAQAHHLKGMT